MAEANVIIDGPADTSPPPLLLTTKLYLPPARGGQSVVPRAHLTQRLNDMYPAASFNVKLTA